MPIWIDPDAPVPVPPVVVESPDGKLTAILDPAHGGIGFVVDLSDESPLPFRARIYRNGTPIMGADPAWIAFGAGELYDRFPQIGTNTYRVAAVHDDGSEGTLSDPVSIEVPDLDCDGSVWLRPLQDASLGMRVAAYDPEPAMVSELVATFGRPVGSTVPGVTVDAMARQPFTLTVDTATVGEAAQLAALCGVASRLVPTPEPGALHFQAMLSFGWPDGWCVPSAHQMVSTTGIVSDPARTHTITLVPVVDPPTIDSPVQIPGRSYADTTATGQTYEASTVRWPLYSDRTGQDLLS